MQNETKWPFEDPKNVAVFTVLSVREEDKPILFVYHNKDDGAWQFHTSRDPSVEEASIVSLEEIVNIDPSLMELADLPLGWAACRETKNSKWQRSKQIRE